MSKTTEPLPDRVQHLKSLSGLHVTARREKNQNIFEFYRGKQMVFSTFTYHKAKCFALGVAYGSQG